MRNKQAALSFQSKSLRHSLFFARAGESSAKVKLRRSSFAKYRPIEVNPILFAQLVGAKLK